MWCFQYDVPSSLSLGCDKRGSRLVRDCVEGRAVELSCGIASVLVLVLAVFVLAEPVFVASGPAAGRSNHLWDVLNGSRQVGTTKVVNVDVLEAETRAELLGEEGILVVGWGNCSPLPFASVKWASALGRCYPDSAIAHRHEKTKTHSCCTMGWPGVEPYESAVCIGACWGKELGLASYGGTAADHC